ncbi:hypothetical protein K8P10_000595 [Leucobacter sp. Psy1]|uniref:molybdenum cofactor guanylyltransferase n=1 Tax=Leucobacter sp. Psy1 TaxID=2875729 RepID=UPI001CD77B14|nr:NTP transferase domain-containing protein [Leucobacter sp. Psy1]UBH05084.1 hypothetical protein K8P10_000595 [Leucobacter sp. Psy1]
MTSLDAVVLAGGRARRLGGVQKADVELGGVRLVDRVAAAARAVGAERVVVVGPDRAASAGAVLVREDPPFSGPLAAVATALPSVDAEWTLLLSCDLVHPQRVCRRLERARRAAGPDAGGFVLRDGDGRAQWLSGVHRTGVLRAGIAALGGDVVDRPLKRVFPEEGLRFVDAPTWETADIDSAEDLDAAQRVTRVDGGR